jgi:hypothetical protein
VSTIDQQSAVVNNCLCVVPVSLARWRRYRPKYRLLLTALACVFAVPSTCPGQTTSPILIDRHMTVGAGAAVAGTVGGLVAAAEDSIVPHRLFGESGAARRTANVLYRLLKFTYFDMPQEQFLLVANHEVFGHGARLRERFDGSIGYRIDAPFPYGEGGGATTFSIVTDEGVTTTEWLAVTVAGMEANAVAAGLIAHRGFVSGRMRTRDAMRYVAFELDTMSYVLETGDEPEELGHDVSDFLRTYNVVSEFAGAQTLTAKRLRREVLVGLANPMVGYALFGIGRYIWNGATDTPVPALGISGVRLLPYVRYRLTPYGTEWALVSELAGRIHPVQIEARFGRAPGTSPFGFGLRRENLATVRQWRVDAAVELWRQPPLDGTTDALRWGTQLRARGERPLSRTWFGDAPITVIIDLAFKTEGFVPGEPLRTGIVVRGGAGIPLSR